MRLAASAHRRVALLHHLLILTAVAYPSLPRVAYALGRLAKRVDALMKLGGKVCVLQRPS